MTLKSAIAIIRQDIEYFGIACAIYDVVVRLLGRFMFVKILRVLALSSITTEHILPSNYRFERIPGEQLPALSKNKEYGLNPVLLQELARGENVCFGIYDGETLANYLFIFLTPVLMSDDLEVIFSSRCAYLCAAFTHPAYRGLHLNSIASGLAFKQYSELDVEALLAYVESNNFSSLKSFRRIGWRTIGTVHIVHLFGRYFIRNGPGCGTYSFRVSPIAGKQRDANSGPAGRIGTANAGKTA